MVSQCSYCLVWLMVSAHVGFVGCNGAGNSAASATGNAAAGGGAVAGQDTVAEKGFFSGRVTLADGAPITLAGVKYTITINGVTAVGERNTFAPKVEVDGTYKFKLPQGLFSPPYGTITFGFEGKNYIFPLEPINPVEETRDGGQGIVQDFTWRLTGPKPRTLNPDPLNATHWYGVTVPLIRAVFRQDTNEPQLPPADGTKITWTLKPTTKRIDGGEAKPLTMERTSGESASVMDTLYDLPPANYEVTAVATLPDGSTKRVLVAYGAGKPFQPTANILLEPYHNSGEIVVNQLHWVFE